MTNRQNIFFKFWKELRRRKVTEVIIIYATTAFIFLQLAPILEESLHLPPWFDTFVTILLIIGFPIAVIFSWVFDVTPTGIQKTENSAVSGETTPKNSIYKNSIAVLPFQDMSPEKDQEYFCDGIAEEIIDALTHIKELKVIARTSAFSFKNKNVDVREIGKQLDVSYLLEGSIRKSGNRIRITAQLVKLDDGTHLYSEHFDRELNDIFEIQDEITMAIADKLKIKLLKNEKLLLLNRYTNNTEVYNLYLLGRYHNYLFTVNDAEKAKTYFEAALRIDPQYAPGYVGLALNYIVLGGGGLNEVSPKIAMPKAKEMCKTALEIDANYSEAHSNLSFIYNMYEWEWSKGNFHAEKAIELDPNNAEAQRFYAWNLTFHGKKEALQRIEKAIELDPLQALSYQNAAAHYYFVARDYKTSIAYGEKTLKLNPNFSVVRINLGMAYIMDGKPKKAIEILEKLTSYPGLSETYLGYAFAVLKNREKVNVLLKQLKGYYKRRLVSASGIALIHLGLNDKEKALDLIESSLSEKPAYSWHTSFLNVDPIWDPLREDNRFKSILAKLGF